jgi:hypothetical protein
MPPTKQKMSDRNMTTVRFFNWEILNRKLFLQARRAPRRRRDPARYGLPAGTTPATSPNSTAFFGNEESGPAVTRSNETDDMNGWCWESVLCSDPEMLIRQASRSSENEDDNPLAQQHRLLEERLQEESLRNPTQAMISVIARIAERERERQTMSWKEQLQHLTVTELTLKDTKDLK